MEPHLRPNESEIAFLNLGYNKFLDIYEQILNESFWTLDPNERFRRTLQGFSIYSEILNYEPVGWYLDFMKRNRPPNEAEIAEHLFKFVRNVLAHFPFFDTWDEVFVNRSLVNWNKEGQSIDRFLTANEGKEQVKFRIWNTKKKV